MNTYHVKIALRILEIYKVQAKDKESAADIWSDGDLIHTDDEALDTEVLSVREA